MGFFDKNGLFRLGFEEFLDVFVFSSESSEFFLVFKVGGGDGELSAELAVDLNDDLDGAFGEGGRIVEWPRVVFAELFEHFGGEMRRERLEEF